MTGGDVAGGGVNAGGIKIGRPSVPDMDRMVRLAADAELTYDFVGSTLHPDAWPQRSAHCEQVELGRGEACFAAAIAGLRDWVCQQGIGAVVHPADAPLVVGSNLIVVLPAGPFSIVVPDRVVEVVDEPRRFGFAYGTLDGHQERGEESFLIEHLDHDTVRATIRVDAHAATVAARLAAPVVGMIQRRALRGYLKALQTHVRAATEETQP